MSSLYEAQRQYALDNPEPADASSWDQMCGSLMYRFNNSIGWGSHPRGDISSAHRVAMGSGWLDPDFRTAPIGAWHYFDIAGPNNGHVMQDARGGGGKCLSTGWDVEEPLGEAIGFHSVSGYVNNRPGRAKYLGWATNYSGGLVNPNYLSSTAGGDITPIVPTKEQLEMARFYRNSETGAIHAINIETGFDWWVPTDAYLKLVKGWGLFPGADDANVTPDVFALVQSLAAGQRAAVGGQLDPAEVSLIAAAVIDGIKPHLRADLSDEDKNDIVTRIATEVPKAVADEYANRLSN